LTTGNSEKRTKRQPTDTRNRIWCIWAFKCDIWW